MFLSIEDVCFPSNDFENVAWKNDPNGVMLHNIMKINEGIWKESLPDTGMQLLQQQYLYKPAFLRFSTPVGLFSRNRIAKELRMINGKTDLEGMWKEIATAFDLHEKEKEKERMILTPSEARRVRPMLQIKDDFSQSTLNKTYQEHRQSQLMSQLCFYTVADTQSALPRDQKEATSRLILPVVAYNDAIEGVFCGIPANLVAFSLLHRRSESTSNVDYARICCEALRKLSHAKHKNVLVIVNFVRSWNEQEEPLGVNCFTQNTFIDSIGNFVAILDRIVM